MGVILSSMILTPEGFESGATEELEHVWKFIENQSTTTELKDQLHAIWYL